MALDTRFRITCECRAGQQGRTGARGNRETGQEAHGMKEKRRGSVVRRRGRGKEKQRTAAAKHDTNITLPYSIPPVRF